MSAIGDLVVNLGMNTAPFSAGANTAIEHMNRLNSETMSMGRRMEECSGSVSGLYRGEQALGHGVEVLGTAMKGINSQLGETVFGMGETVRTVGMATHAFHGLVKVIDACRNSQIMLNLVSGPRGWAVLAGSIMAAAGAYLYFHSAAEKVNEIKIGALKGEELEVYRERTPHEELSGATKYASDAQAQISHAQEAFASMKNEMAEYQAKWSQIGTGNYYDPALVEEMTTAEVALMLATSENATASEQLAAAQERVKEVTLASDIEKLTEKLTLEAETFGMTANEAAGYALERRGAETADLAEASAIATLLQAKKNMVEIEKEATKAAQDAARAQERLVEQGMRLAETPLDQYNEKIRALDAAMQAGMTPEQYAEGHRKAFEATPEGQAEEQRRRAAEAIGERLESPYQKWAQQMEQLESLKPYLSGETYSRAVAEANAKYAAATGGKLPKAEREELPKVLQKDTAEAWGKIASIMYGTDQEKFAESTADNTARIASGVEQLVNRDPEEEFAFS